MIPQALWGQYFCGEEIYQPSYPCNPTELVKFRQRIGKEGVNLILKQTILLFDKKLVQEKEVIVDTTTQEKNITYPTDAKLAIKIINKLLKIAKKEKIKLRRTYIKEIKQHRINLRFFKHPKKIKKAKASMKRLRTIAKTILRDIDRKFGELDINNLNSYAMYLHNKYAKEFYLFMRVLLQDTQSKNKIYSLHEPHVYATNKGKEHKKYEYGVKSTIVKTKDSNIILSVAVHDKNIHDSKTLNLAISNTHNNTNTPIQKAICDRGYRGTKEKITTLKNKKITTTISIPDNNPKKTDTKYQKDKKRKSFRRRASIVLTTLAEFRFATWTCYWSS